MAARVRAVGLRSVQPGEKGRPKSVSQAAESGSHRDLLVAMRTRIAQSVEDPATPPRDLAALSRRLQDIAKEIAVIDARAKEDGDAGDVTPDEQWDASAI